MQCPLQGIPEGLGRGEGGPDQGRPRCSEEAPGVGVSHRVLLPSRNWRVTWCLLSFFKASLIGGLCQPLTVTSKVTLTCIFSWGLLLALVFAGKVSSQTRISTCHGSRVPSLHRSAPVARAGWRSSTAEPTLSARKAWCCGRGRPVTCRSQGAG